MQINFVNINSCAVLFISDNVTTREEQYHLTQKEIMKLKKGVLAEGL
ncbi:MAG: hypothetical protein MUP57_00715 [Clostridia bacterium]|nr:hypothetical protein [Clostridia bacterium]